MTSDSTPPPSDPGLWRCVIAGDADAFVNVYEALADAVFGFCLRRTGDWEAAEDCTSLVFLEAWRLRTTLRDESAGLSWLFGLAHNVVRNAARARRRHLALLAKLPLHDSDFDPGFESDAAERLDAAERAADLAAALSRLPKHQRDVLAIAGGTGFGPVEIARILNLPVGTVKSRLARGRRRLLDLDRRRDAAPLQQTTPLAEGTSQ